MLSVYFEFVGVGLVFVYYLCIFVFYVIFLSFILCALR